LRVTLGIMAMMSSSDKTSPTSKASSRSKQKLAANEAASDPLKNASDELVRQLANVSQKKPEVAADEPQDLASLAIAGMAMTSFTTASTEAQSPLGQPGPSQAANPAVEHLRLRAENAERQVYEFQHYVQQVLQQLSYMTRRAENAEHYAKQMHLRAEHAESLLEQANEMANAPAAQAFKTDQRTKDWIQAKLAETQSKNEEFSESYLQSLERMSKGKYGEAIESLTELVQEQPKTLSYRTALHLAQGFLLHQQGMNPHLTQRFERAMLIENNVGKPRPPLPTKK
jgi:hypothetical protein